MICGIERIIWLIRNNDDVATSPRPLGPSANKLCMNKMYETTVVELKLFTVFSFNIF